MNTRTASATTTLTEPADISAPVGIDVSRASIARVRDYWLGGGDSHPPDQVLGRRMLKIAPDWRRLVSATADWRLRAASYIASAGIDQIVDIGTGIPEGFRESLHRAIQDRGRGPATVVYVDNDQMSASHCRALLENRCEKAFFVAADPADPAALLAPDRAGQYVDLSRPVGLILADVLHYIPDSAGPAEVMARYIQTIAPGSIVALAHYCRPSDHDEVATTLEAALHEHLVSGTFRRPETIASFLTGLDPLPPGLVPPAAWEPDELWRVPDPSAAHLILAAVAIKPQNTTPRNPRRDTMFRSRATASRRIPVDQAPHRTRRPSMPPALSTVFDDDPEESEPQPPTRPVMPSVVELRAAMTGAVPEQHPARKILLGARMLATLDEWVNPDRVTAEDPKTVGTLSGYDYAGSEMLDEIGIASINDLVRAPIIDRINCAAGGWYHDRIGHAVAEIARADWEWRRADHPDTRTSHDPRLHQWIVRSRRWVVAAQRDYRMLVNGRAWIEGPGPAPRDRR